jgi:molybdenum cofactor biosynthesis enzyme
MAPLIDHFGRVHTYLCIATSQATLTASQATIARIKQRVIPKGNPLEVAKVAAIQAAKSTSQLIPYCHPVPVAFVGVRLIRKEGGNPTSASNMSRHFGRPCW